jgi:hypothetical protein
MAWINSTLMNWNPLQQPWREHLKINLTKELSRDLLDAAYVCYVVGIGLGNEMYVLIQNIHALYPGMLQDKDCVAMAHFIAERK